MVRPPPFRLMACFLFLRHTPQFIGRISEHTVEYSAAGILAIDISLVSQSNHLLGQLDSQFDVVIAGFHQITLFWGEDDG